MCSMGTGHLAALVHRYRSAVHCDSDDLESLRTWIYNSGMDICVQFADINGDGSSDVIISAPFRSESLLLERES